MLEKALTDLGWEQSERTGPSVGQAFAAVREASGCEADKEKFLVEKSRSIREAGDSAKAFEWLGKVLGSDGLDRREVLFLEKVRGFLFD